MSTSDDEKKRNALLTFFQKIAPSLHESSKTFECLAQGHQLYEMLCKVAPAFFSDTSMKMEIDGAAANWVLRKSNIVVLLNDMNVYARTALSASSDFDVQQLVDAAAVAKVQDGGSGEEYQQGVDRLAVLCDIVFVMMVLSGNPEAISAIKTLPKEEQALLNQSAKKTMGVHGLKPAKKGAVPPAAGSSGTTPTVASPGLMSGSLERHHSNDSVELSVLLNENSQLRNELKDRQALFHELESRCELAEKERRETQERYRALLEESESLRTASNSEKQWMQQAAKKDETIRDLSNAVKEFTAKLSAAKEKHAALQDDVDHMRERIAECEALVKQKTDEKQEVMTQLSILQDRYDVSMRGKKEQSEEVQSLQGEVESLRAEVALLRSKDSHSAVQQPQEDDSFQHQQSLEDEISVLREQLSAALSELNLFRKSGLSATTTAAVDSPHRGSGAPTFIDDETPNRTMLASTATTAALEMEMAKLQADVAALHQALALRDSRVLELERQASSLEGHLQRSVAELEDRKTEAEALLQEKQKLEQDLTAAAVAAQKSKGAQDAIKEAETLRKQNSEILTRLSERSEATRKEQAILVSTVVRYGHKNLMLQQRQLLANSSNAVADGDGRTSGSATNYVMSVWNSFVLGSPTQDMSEIPGSFLTKHRRALERGLLDSLLTAPPISSSGGDHHAPSKR